MGIREAGVTLASYSIDQKEGTKNLIGLGLFDILRGNVGGSDIEILAVRSSTTAVRSVAEWYVETKAPNIKLPDTFLSYHPCSWSAHAVSEDRKSIRFLIAAISAASMHIYPAGNTDPHYAGLSYTYYGNKWGLFNAIVRYAYVVGNLMRITQGQQLDICCLVDDTACTPLAALHELKTALRVFYDRDRDALVKAFHLVQHFYKLDMLTIFNSIEYSKFWPYDFDLGQFSPSDKRHMQAVDEWYKYTDYIFDLTNNHWS